MNTSSQNWHWQSKVLVLGFLQKIDVTFSSNLESASNVASTGISFQNRKSKLILFVVRLTKKEGIKLTIKLMLSTE